MRSIYILFIIFLFICCKKNNPNNEYVSDLLIKTPFANPSVQIDSTVLINTKNSDLITFYKKFNNHTVWFTKEDRTILLEELKNCRNEGLLPNDYNFDKLSLTEKSYDQLNTNQLIDFDLLFTQSMQKYISHVFKGKIFPKLVYHDWDLKEKTIAINEVLFEVIENKKFKEKLESLKPNHFIYKKLKEALQILNAFPEDTIPFITLRPKDKISLNKSHRVVKTLKLRLMYWHDMKHSDTITSIYDKEAQNAVKVFQSRHGLYPDGVIGKSTILAINYSRNQRIEQVIVNLERWRWFAHDFGNNYLLINIPDYNLVAVKNGDTLQNQRVVVGKETRQTPVIESKVTNINLNPNWTVPPTILKEDLYPDAIVDKAVFKQRGLTIIDRNNNTIDPLNWKIEEAKKYKYVQNPGRDNSLGLMKINFPNKFSVYLHDTNHRDFFSYNYRSLSSGCVRLEKPLEMAAYLINDEEKWNLKTIQDTTDINYYNKLQKDKEKKIAIKNAKILAKNPLFIIPETTLKKPTLKTIVIKVKEDVFIHQLYWTAWCEKGKLQFREDIYCRDANLYSKLRY